MKGSKWLTILRIKHKIPNTLMYSNGHRTWREADVTIPGN
jgi:hypothetical protein